MKAWRAYLRGSIADNMKIVRGFARGGSRTPTNLDEALAQNIMDLAVIAPGDAQRILRNLFQRSDTESQSGGAFLCWDDALWTTWGSILVRGFESSLESVQEQEAALEVQQDTDKAWGCVLSNANPEKTSLPVRLTDALGPFDWSGFSDPIWPLALKRIQMGEDAARAKAQAKAKARNEKLGSDDRDIKDRPGLPQWYEHVLKVSVLGLFLLSEEQLASWPREQILAARASLYEPREDGSMGDPRSPKRILEIMTGYLHETGEEGTLSRRRHSAMLDRAILTRVAAETPGSVRRATDESTADQKHTRRRGRVM